jgi:hypothetical protein
LGNFGNSRNPRITEIQEIQEFQDDQESHVKTISMKHAFLLKIQRHDGIVNQNSHIVFFTLIDSNHNGEF